MTSPTTAAGRFHAQFLFSPRDTTPVCQNPRAILSFPTPVATALLLPVLPLRETNSAFPIPDWSAIARQADELSEDTDLNAFWTERGRDWVHLLKKSLGPSYIGYESRHFWLISSQSDTASRRIIAWLESTRVKVVNALGLDVSNHGKCPVIVTQDLETYYAYIAGYMPEDENALSGGMYLNHGYGHFIFTYLDMGQAEAVLAHELTHSLVAHLPIPAWLNEGVAQLCEQAATGRDHANYEDIRDTLGTYWTSETIQDLWSGRGFNRQDEGQLQSYHLSKVLTHMLTGDRARFLAFLHEAHYSDAGAAALLKHFDVSLEALVSDYLGEGVWAPLLPTTDTLPVNQQKGPHHAALFSPAPVRDQLIEISSTSNTSTEPAGIAPWARLP